MEHIDLGSSPADEGCAQVGRPGYEERAREECDAYRDQLLRAVEARFGALRPGTPFRIRVASRPHDFGPYLEVVASFDPSDADAARVAEWLEAEGPTAWDAEALKRLRCNSPSNGGTI